MDSRKECLHVQSLLSHRALSIMQKRANSTLLARKARNTTRNLRFQVLAENKVETKWKKLLITEYHYWGSEEEIKNALWLFSFWYSYTNFRESLSPLEGSLSCASKKYNLSSSYVNFSCCVTPLYLVQIAQHMRVVGGLRWVGATRLMMGFGFAMRLIRSVMILADTCHGVNVWRSWRVRLVPAWRESYAIVSNNQPWAYHHHGVTCYVRSMHAHRKKHAYSFFFLLAWIISN